MADKAAFVHRETCAAKKAAKQESLPPTPSALCLRISNEDGGKPSRFQKLGTCRSLSALCLQQVNDNATTNLETSKPSLTSTRRRRRRHRLRGKEAIEARSAPKAEDVEEGAYVAKAHLKAINDLKVEATATLQRVKSLLKKLCEERTEEFKRKQVREYNIRWQV
ncbi:hypothetical protein TSMEX_004158 [Taenia solium]|eukprot:TsM_000465700 transcript=TsM_000465700 gene=TsM_000465700